MPKNFYLQNEPQAVAGAAAFAGMISASPESYGLSPELAASFASINEALQTAYDAARNPSTRTMPAVAGKNTALRAMRQGAMNLAAIVRAASVTDAQLIGLGLLPRPVRTKIAAPAQSPVVKVRAVTGRLVSLHVRPIDSPRRGKADGASGAYVYSFVGDQPPADRRGWHFEGLTTRARTQITFPNDVPSGATVWLSACWVSARGQTSPCCPPVSFTLQGGRVVPESA